MMMVGDDDYHDGDDGDSGLSRMWTKTKNKTKQLITKVKFKPTEAKRNLSDSCTWEFRHGRIQEHKCYLSTLT